MPDTDATPAVQIVAAGDLGTLNSAEKLPVDSVPVTPTDKAKAVLLTAVLTFSEAVTSNGAQSRDLGLPVSADTFGAGTAVANGRNPQVPNRLTMALSDDQLLTPGGVYSAGMLLPGSATGVFVADGTRIVDAAANAALSQMIGTAVDLQPGTESISIAWDDLSIAPRNWAMGASSVGAVHRASGAFPPNGLVARNSGNVREKFTVSCSGASPANWTLATAAGHNQFEMKADNGAGNYALNLAAGPQDIVGGLYASHFKAFDLQFRLPTSVTAGVGVEQTITVTMTATKD
jgi:hypothetical protein